MFDDEILEKLYNSIQIKTDGNIEVLFRRQGYGNRIESKIQLVSNWQGGFLVRFLFNDCI